jgi:hypothetical protein
MYMYPTTTWYVACLPLGVLVSKGHAFQLIEKPPPVVCQHLRVFDPLLRPVLVPPANVILRLLKVHKFVPDAFLDEDGPIVLVDN